MSDDFVSDETLMAYADGELDSHSAELLVQRLDGDAELRRRLDMFQSTRNAVRDAFGGVLDEPVPDRLPAAIAARAASAEEQPRTVTPFRRPAPKPEAGRWHGARGWRVAMAASLVGLLCGGIGYGLGSLSQPVEMAESGEPAGLALPADILDGLASGERREIASGFAVEPVATFRDRNDRLCREVEMTPSGAAAMITIHCRTDDRWTVRFAMETGGGEGYQPASSLAALDGYLDAIGAGAPMSPEEEMSALGDAD